MRCDVHLGSWLDSLAGKKPMLDFTFDDFKLDDVMSQAGIEVRFDYPIDKPVTLRCDGPVTYRQFITFVAEAYRDIIYTTADPYQIWGHGLGDLFLEGAVFKNGMVELIMGS